MVHSQSPNCRWWKKTHAILISLFLRCTNEHVLRGLFVFKDHSIWGVNPQVFTMSPKFQRLPSDFLKLVCCLPGSVKTVSLKSPSWKVTCAVEGNGAAQHMGLLCEMDTVSTGQNREPIFGAWNLVFSRDFYQWTLLSETRDVCSNNSWGFLYVLYSFWWLWDGGLLVQSLQCFWLYSAIILHVCAWCSVSFWSSYSHLSSNDSKYVCKSQVLHFPPGSERSFQSSQGLPGCILSAYCSPGVGVSPIQHKAERGEDWGYFLLPSQLFTWNFLESCVCVCVKESVQTRVCVC